MSNARDFLARATTAAAALNMSPEELIARLSVAAECMVVHTAERLGADQETARAALAANWNSPYAQGLAEAGLIGALAAGVDHARG